MNNCIHLLRTLGATILLILAFSNLSGCSQAPAQTKGILKGDAPRIADGEDWASFLGPRGNGTSSEKGLEPALWNPHPPILWELQLGVSYGGPSIVGNKFYQFDRVGDKERLSCYDLATAQPLWYWDSGSTPYRDPYGYNNGPRCSPIVDGNLIFVYGVTGNLYCIDANSHKLVWKKETFSEYGVIPNFFGVASNPAAFQDKLLVMIGGSPAESQGLTTQMLAQVKPNGSAVVAFDKKTGNELYKVGDDLASYTSMSVQTVNGKHTGLAFLRSGLLAFDPSTGTEIHTYPWRADFLESVNASVPVTDGQRVLVSESYQIGSTLLDAQSTPWTEVWKDKAISKPVELPSTGQPRS
ncbi:MAG: PQQ-binding-like beta-propeller repeat protein [Pirellulales bacterium]